MIRFFADVLLCFAVFYAGWRLIALESHIMGRTRENYSGFWFFCDNFEPQISSNYTNFDFSVRNIQKYFARLTATYRNKQQLEMENIKKFSSFAVTRLSIQYVTHSVHPRGYGSNIKTFQHQQWHPSTRRQLTAIMKNSENLEEKFKIDFIFSLRCSSLLAIFINPIFVISSAVNSWILLG